MAINEWSTTAASNASGVTGVNWAEGQAPSTVNDSARAMMADVAAWYGQAKTPEYLTGVAGTNSVTAGGPASLAAYGAGQRFTFLPAATNTGATTLNITPSGGAALGAKNIYWNGAACVGGELRISVPVAVMYDGTQFQIIGSASTVQVKGATLTANRIPYAVGASSLVQDSANLTFDGSTLTLAGTLTLTGAQTISTTLAVTGHTTFEGVTSTGATGTGNLVYSASPTFTGTLAAAAGTFSSTLGVAGAITSTIGNNSQVIAATSATTGYLLGNFSNTGGGIQWGVDASTGGSLITGSGAYDAAIRTVGATHLWLATNSGNAPQVKIVHTASATRYVTLTGSNGGNPTIDVSAGSLAFTPHLVVEGVTSTGATGTGKFVFDASPTFTGVPAAPTAAVGTNTTQLATTAFVSAFQQQITASLGADVALNNTANYFDGPSVAQGTSGTWFASGTVTMNDTSAADFDVKLWDGTTVIASTHVTNTAAAGRVTASLSGYLASPAANIRISVKDTTTTAGKILFNNSGNSKDSTITAFKVAN